VTCRRDPLGTRAGLGLYSGRHQLLIDMSPIAPQTVVYRTAHPSRPGEGLTSRAVLLADSLPLDSILPGLLLP